MEAAAHVRAPEGLIASLNWMDAAVRTGRRKSVSGQECEDRGLSVRSIHSVSGAKLNRWETVSCVQHRLFAIREGKAR